MPHIGEIMAVSCALCWAIAVLLFRRVPIMDPRGLNLFKNTIAFALLLITLWLTGGHIDWQRSPEDWLRLAGSALLGLTLGDTLFFAGLQRIGASVAAVTDCVYSPTVVALSVVFLGESPHVGLLLGAPLVAAGLVLVSWQGQTTAAEKVDRLGVLLSVSGVFATAIGVIIAKPALDHSDLIEATTVRLFFAAASLLVWQMASGRLRSSFAMFRPQPMWRPMIPATLVGTYLSMLLWMGGIKYTQASHAALLNQMATVFLLLLSRFVGGEVVPPRRWIGAGIAVVGVLLVLRGAP